MALSAYINGPKYLKIESIIRENYDGAVEVIHEAPAEQFRESLRMAIPIASIQQAERKAAASS